ncbi:MAG: ATP-binding protein [Patescibacteria group bacterium]|nr:ATP-binding protein [Patescibacteria group bacterium]
MNPKILLGFEIGTGEAQYIEPSHLIVTGISSRSGKTTTLEALAERSGAKLLIFSTKPGEKIFTNARTIPSYYSSRSDWKYVESLLEALLRERMKYDRYWIIESCRGTKTLKEVDQNISKYLSQAKPDSYRFQAYTLLHTYFEDVLPALNQIHFTSEFPKLEIGSNLMDLTEMPVEVQSLVIQSCLEHVLKHEENIITVIPELWKFAPQGRGNPVKRELESLIRQGAVKHNFVWMDSQDLSGVDKLPLKQVFHWVMGLQTESNEVQHTIDQIPLPSKERPKTDEIMSLKKGQFILASPGLVKHVYVCPIWLAELEAQKVARGEQITEEDWSDVYDVAEQALRQITMSEIIV